jgi:hypothetical protein
VAHEQVVHDQPGAFVHDRGRCCRIVQGVRLVRVEHLEAQVDEPSAAGHRHLRDLHPAAVDEGRGADDGTGPRCGYLYLGPIRSVAGQPEHERRHERDDHHASDAAEQADPPRG